MPRTGKALTPGWNVAASPIDLADVMRDLPSNRSCRAEPFLNALGLLLTFSTAFFTEAVDRRVLLASQRTRNSVREANAIQALAED